MCNFEMLKTKSFVKYIYIYLFIDRKPYRRIPMRGCKRRERYATIRSYVICSGPD